jgi:hypothetical protein
MHVVWFASDKRHSAYLTRHPQTCRTEKAPRDTIVSRRWLAVLTGRLRSGFLWEQDMSIGSGQADGPFPSHFQPVCLKSSMNQDRFEPHAAQKPPIRAG